MIAHHTARVAKKTCVSNAQAVVQIVMTGSAISAWNNVLPASINFAVNVWLVVMNVRSNFAIHVYPPAHVVKKKRKKTSFVNLV